MPEFLKKFRRPLAILGLLLVALVIFSDRLRHQEQTTLFEKTVLRLTAPVHEAFDRLRDGWVYAWDRYFWLIDTAEENARLVEENQRLRARLDAVEEIRLANDRLERLLGFKEQIALPSLPAQVIAEDITSWFRTVVIDKGEEDGVREGSAVVVPDGVVGRVIKVAPKQSRVLLVTDASSAAAALVQRTRSRGIARGRGQSLTLDYVLREDEVRVGDRIITSGMGGVFPKGLVIGRVSDVVRGQYGLFQNIEVIPAADFARLEEVLVLGDKTP